MVGVLVDSTRMHVTKANWKELLDILTGIVGRPVREFHTNRFYGGHGIWRAIDGPERANIISAILDWLTARRHHIVYSAVDTAKFAADFAAHRFGPDIGTLWRMLALHVSLALQRHNQREDRNKGNTVLVFDNKETEQAEFTNLLLNPPAWTDTYYDRQPAIAPLDQIIDVPHFVDSEHVGLIQVSDLIAFTLRRHLEIVDGGDAERYAGESARIEVWVNQALARSIGKPCIYPIRGRCDAAEFFCEFGPASLQ